MAKKPTEKENITFRLDKDTLERINLEAEQRGGEHEFGCTERVFRLF
jgi:hypothetical protein